MLLSLLQKIFPSVESKLTYLNKDGTILTLTERVAKEKGIKKEEVKGKPYGRLYNNSNLEDSHYQHMLELADKRGMVSRPIVLQDKDGRFSQLRVTISAVRDENKKIIGYTVRDKVV